MVSFNMFSENLKELDRLIFFFASESSFESPNLETLVRKMKTTKFGDVDPFTMVDLQNAVRHMKRNICAHSKDVVAICSVYEVVSCKNTYFMYDNLVLADGHVE